jgi:hypothetical protein
VELASQELEWRLVMFYHAMGRRCGKGQEGKAPLPENSSEHSSQLVDWVGCWPATFSSPPMVDCFAMLVVVGPPHQSPSSLSNPVVGPGFLI